MCPQLPEGSGEEQRLLSWMEHILRGPMNIMYGFRMKFSKKKYQGVLQQQLKFYQYIGSSKFEKIAKISLLAIGAIDLI